MGWWRTASGGVIGDAPANYIEELAMKGQVFVEPCALPADVRKELGALYEEGLGREPTDAELLELLSFCR